MMGRNSYSDTKIFVEKTQLFNFYLTFNNVSNVLFMLVSMLLQVTSQMGFGVLKSCIIYYWLLIIQRKYIIAICIFYK